MTTTKTLKTLPVNTELINDASFDDWGQCLANLKFEGMDYNRTGITYKCC